MPLIIIVVVVVVAAAAAVIARTQGSVAKGLTYCQGSYFLSRLHRDRLLNCPMFYYSRAALLNNMYGLARQKIRPPLPPRSHGLQVDGLLVISWTFIVASITVAGKAEFGLRLQNPPGHRQLLTSAAGAATCRWHSLL